MAFWLKAMDTYKGKLTGNATADEKAAARAVWEKAQEDYFRRKRELSQ